MERGGCVCDSLLGEGMVSWRGNEKGEDRVEMGVWRKGAPYKTEKAWRRGASKSQKRRSTKEEEKGKMSFAPNAMCRGAAIMCRRK